MHARKLPRISEPSFDKNYASNNNASTSGHYDDSYRSSKASKYLGRRSSISPEHHVRRDRDALELQSALNSPYRDRSPIGNSGYRHNRHNRDRRDRSRRDRHKFRKDNAPSSSHRSNDLVTSDRRPSPSSRRGQIGRTVESNVSKQTSTNSTSALRSVGDWSEHVSSSGKEYYYNCVTEVSQWEKPREWLDFEHQQNRLRNSYNEAATTAVHEDNNAGPGNNSHGSAQNHHQHQQHPQQQMPLQHQQSHQPLHQHSHSQPHHTQQQLHHHQFQPKLTGGNSRQMGLSDRYVRSDSSLSSRLSGGINRPRENRKRRNEVVPSRNRTHTERHPSLTAQPLTTTMSAPMLASSASSSASSPSSTSQGVSPPQISENGDNRVNDDQVISSVIASSSSVTSLSSAPSSYTTTTTTSSSTSLSTASGAANVSDAIRTIHSALMGLNQQHQMTAGMHRQSSVGSGQGGVTTDSSGHSDTHNNQVVSAQSAPHLATHVSHHEVSKSSPLLSSGQSLTASLSRFCKESLVSHVVGWPAEGVERMAQRRNEEHSTNLHLNVARVSAELKMARSLVRLAEIQATLQEQRILFLRQQSVDLEALRTGSSSKSLMDTSAITPTNHTTNQSAPPNATSHRTSRESLETAATAEEVTL